MKLAEGSRWADGAVVDSDGIVCEIAVPDEGPLFLCVGHEDDYFGVLIPDVLAVIDAAGLDKVRAAARELKRLREARHPSLRHDINTQEIKDDLIMLCRALDEETETDG
jgi:hypothetical protein